MEQLCMVSAGGELLVFFSSSMFCLFPGGLSLDKIDIEVKTNITV
jgi:hypothetical protein